MSGNPTYQDLTAGSDDKFRVADHSPRIYGFAGDRNFADRRLARETYLKWAVSLRTDTRGAFLLFNSLDSNRKSL